jgi:hypothetical protein
LAVKASLGFKNAGPNGGFHLLLGHGAMAVEVMLGWTAPGGSSRAGCKCKQRTQAGLVAARRAGRTGGRLPKLTEDDIEAAEAVSSHTVGIKRRENRLLLLRSLRFM